MMPTTGYTYPDKRICIRCGAGHNHQLYMLCGDCRQDDIEHNWELLREGRNELVPNEEERDREDIIHLGRYGY